MNRSWLLPLAGALLACQSQGGVPPSDGGAPDVGGGAWNVTSNPSPEVDVPEAVALDGDLLFIAGETGVNDTHTSSALRIECRSAKDGSLVPTFGNGGAVELTPSAGYNAAAALAVDDSAVYLVGSSEPTGTANWFMARFDKTTGATGWTQTSPSGSQATSVAVDASGLYVVGRHDGAMRWTIEKRQLADGSLVQGFGTGGIVDVASGADALSVVVDGTGAIEVAGDGLSGTDAFFPLEARRAQDGAVLWTKNAFANLAPGGAPGHVPLALDGASLFVSLDGPSNAVVVEKYDLGGALDTSFGTAGEATWTDQSGMFFLSGLVASSGDAFVIGYAELGGKPADTQWRVAALDEATGAPASSFGAGGVATVNPSSGDDWALAVAANADAVFVVGTDVPSADQAWRIDRIPR